MEVMDCVASVMTGAAGGSAAGSVLGFMFTKAIDGCCQVEATEAELEDCITCGGLGGGSMGGIVSLATYKIHG